MSTAPAIRRGTPDFELVRFVLFDTRALQIFAQAFAEIAEKREEFQ